MVTTADAVAEKWRRARAEWELADGDLGDLSRVMTAMIDAAQAVPVLRQLFAGTSHFTLCFSTCAVHFYSDDIPAIEPRQGEYYGDRRAGLGYVVRNRPRGDVIAEASDAESAIALLLAHLPANVGPATGACRHAKHPGQLPPRYFRLERGQPA